MKRVEKSSPGQAITGSGEKQEGTSSLRQSQMDTKPVKWTNEKHSLYLDSMEASFVHQLHNALDLHGRRSLKCASSRPNPMSQNHAPNRNPSGQFKIFKNGSWHKTEFCQGERGSDQAYQVGSLSSNAWIQHYRSGGSQHTRASPSLQQVSANINDDSSAPRFHSCHEDAIRSKAGGSNLSLEGTDQNFADEDTNEEGKGRTQSKKRMKKTSVNHPGQDQVVPLGKFPYAEDVADV